MTDYFELQRWQFFPDQCLGFLAHRMLLATNNTLIAEQDINNVLSDVLDQLIGRGKLNKENITFHYLNNLLDNKYSLDVLQLQKIKGIDSFSVINDFKVLGFHVITFDNIDGFGVTKSLYIFTQ